MRLYRCVTASPKGSLRLRGALLHRMRPTKSLPSGARGVRKKPNGLAFSAERRCGCTAAGGRLSRSGRRLSRRRRRRMRGKKVTLPSKLVSRVFPHQSLAAVPQRDSFPQGKPTLRGALLFCMRPTKSLPSGARSVRKSQTAWLFPPSADAAVLQRMAFRPKGEKTDEGAIVNIHHLIRRFAPPSPHRGRNTGAAHCFIGCG